MFTARAATSAIVTSDVSDCASMTSLAIFVSGRVSVGLNADAFVKAT